MKKFLTLILTLALLITSSTLPVYAGDNGSKVNNYDINYLRKELKKYHKNKEKRTEILKMINEAKKRLEDEDNKNSKSNKNSKNNKSSKNNNGNKNSIKNRNKNLSIYVNGEEIQSDVPPVIKSGRFNIPVAPITKALGADIKWDRKTGDVTITKGDTVIVIKTGSNIITVNGVEVKLDDYVQSNSNRTFVPISFISKVLKYKVIIDEDTDSIIVEDDDLVAVNDNSTGNGNNKFEYLGDWKYGKQTGAYMEDNHWSSEKDAYFYVRFTGTQIKLYGAKAPNHGIAAISIDGGKEVLADYYAKERKDDTLIYKSPVLSAGQHILKVRVTGTKNIKSTDFFITADRVEVAETDKDSNLALNRPVKASSSIETFDAKNAVDGKVWTRWSSEYSDNQWIYVDLGNSRKVDNVKLKWENAYAKEYKIQVSNDTAVWADVYHTKAGDGGIDDIKFTPVSARYVRIQGIARGTQYGYSLWEFEVYNTGSKLEGVLSGSVSDAPSSVSLTGEGKLDWVHWGHNGVSGLNRKSGVVQKITNFAKLGDTNVAWIAGDVNPVAYSWTDGTPESSVAGTRTAVYLSGKDSGFQIFVPADTVEKTLKVYVGAWASKGRFEATLSDGSALPYVEYVDAESGIKCKEFTVRFKAKSDDQLLTVKYTVDNVYTENIGNITLQAAALK